MHLWSPSFYFNQLMHEERGYGYIGNYDGLAYVQIGFSNVCFIEFSFVICKSMALESILASSIALYLFNIRIYPSIDDTTFSINVLLNAFTSGSCSFPKSERESAF